MSLRTVHGVFEFLVGQREEALKHDNDFDLGRESALKTAIDLLARVDECDVEKLHTYVAKFLGTAGALLLLMPVWWN